MFVTSRLNNWSWLYKVLSQDIIINCTLFGELFGTLPLTSWRMFMSETYLYILSLDSGENLFNFFCCFLSSEVIGLEPRALSRLSKLSTMELREPSLREFVKENPFQSLSETYHSDVAHRRLNHPRDIKHTCIFFVCVFCFYAC